MSRPHLRNEKAINRKRIAMMSTCLIYPIANGSFFIILILLFGMIWLKEGISANSFGVYNKY